MSHLREVKRHLHSLEEIRGIMNSMKSLAYMEVRKLGALLAAQHQVAAHIGAAAADFLDFHPVLPDADPQAANVRIVVGTERGFCGDFNQGLVRRLSFDDAQGGRRDTALIVIGRKLRNVMEADGTEAERVIFIDGADVAEEAARIIGRVVMELAALAQVHGPLAVSSLYRGDDGEVVGRRLLPPSFQDFRDTASEFTHPPVLNLPPDRLLVELTDQYLFAALHEVMFRSMLTENQHRVIHLGAAVQHLDEKSARLVRRVNALHQEEIIEEIEVILLSADAG